MKGGAPRDELADRNLRGQALPGLELKLELRVKSELKVLPSDCV